MAKLTKSEEKFLSELTNLYDLDGGISAIEQKVLDGLKKEFSKSGQSKWENVDKVFHDVLGADYAAVLSTGEKYTKLGEKLTTMMAEVEKLKGEQNTLQKKHDSHAWYEFYDKGKINDELKQNRNEIHAASEKVTPKDLKEYIKAGDSFKEAMSIYSEDSAEIEMPKIQRLAEKTGLKSKDCPHK